MSENKIEGELKNSYLLQIIKLSVLSRWIIIYIFISCFCIVTLALYGQDVYDRIILCFTNHMPPYNPYIQAALYSLRIAGLLLLFQQTTEIQSKNENALRRIKALIIGELILELGFILIFKEKVVKSLTRPLVVIGYLLFFLFDYSFLWILMAGYAIHIKEFIRNIRSKLVK